MSNIIPAFDPSASPNGGKFDTLLGSQAGGKVVLFSDSPYTIIVVTTSGNRYRIPASVGRRIDFDQDETCSAMTWSIESVLNVSAALSPQVYGESYEAEEEIPETYPISLNRFVNVGNQSNVTTATAVINDNSAVPTTVVETTPSGQTTSAFLVKNDGTFTVRSISSGVWTTLISLTPGGPSTPASLVLHGTADNVPASGVTAGTLAGSVLLTTISSDGGTITSDGAGDLTLGGNLTVKVVIFGDVVSASQSELFFVSANHAITLSTPLAGAAALGIDFETWDGVASHVPFSIGGQFGGAASWADNSGNHFATSFQINAPIGGTYPLIEWVGGNNAIEYWSPQSGATPLGHLFVTWNGSALVVPFSLGGQLAGALAYVDNSGQLHASGTSIVASGIRNGNGQIFRVSSFFSGAAMGTFSHGLGATPAFVGMTTTQVNSTETVGVDTIGATTCHCNEPNSWPFVCMATF